MSCISASTFRAEAAALPRRAALRDAAGALGSRVARGRGLASAAALVLVASLMSACETVAPRPYPPKVHIESMRVVAFSERDVRVRFDLAVENPNAFALRVVSMDSTIAFDDAPFGMGKTTGAVVLAPGARTRVSFDFRTSFPALVYAADHLAQRPRLVYDLTGSVILEGGLRLSFAHRGDIATPDFHHPEAAR